MNFSFAQLGDLWTRLRFKRALRIQLYETLGLLLENSIGLLDALLEIYKSEAGKPYVPSEPPSGRSSVAVVVYDCITAVRSGKTLSVGLHNWVSPMEYSLIASGERTGSYQRAFDRSIVALTKQGELLGAVAKALAYPTIVFGVIIGIYGMVGFMLAPELLKVAPIDKWVPDTANMLTQGMFIANHWFAMTLAALLLIGSLLVSLSQLRGRLRDTLDILPPWSVYRLFYGSVFMLNVAVMLKCGIALEQALKMLNEHANPYLSERLSNTLRGVRAGRTFGAALANTKHNFPSKRAVTYIELLSNKKGFDQALETFTLRSLDMNVKEIGRAASRLMIVALLGAGYAVSVIGLGVMGISESASNIASHPPVMATHSSARPAPKPTR
jgi:type II secretory pathway component PulF